MESGMLNVLPTGESIMEHHHSYYYSGFRTENEMKKRFLKCWSILLWPLERS